MNVETLEYIGWTTRAGQAASYYITLTTVPLGVILNILMFITFLRKKFNHLTMSFYYQVINFLELKM